MGAIYGLIGDGSEDEVRAMGARLAHRGERERVWSPSPGVVLGERIHREGDAAACETVAGDLQIHDADPRAIEAQLRESGIDALNDLRGVFSLAWWNDDERALVLACDHVAYKSIHYAELSGRLVFASEYKAFLALSDLPLQPDREVIQFHQATRLYPVGRTFLAGVRTLEPGAVLVRRAGKTEHRRYWVPRPRYARRSAAGHATAVREGLLEVVARQCRPYPRIAVSMGAGLDSAVLLASIRRTHPEAELASLTAGFGDEDPEVLGARVVSEHFGTEHREIHFAPEQIPRELPRLVWMMEDCAGREEALLHLLVLSAAGESERVVAGGYGADMLFGGMPRHRLLRLADLFPWWRKPLHELFELTQSGSPPHSPTGRLLQRLVYRGKQHPPPEVVGAGGPARVGAPRDLADFMLRTAIDMHDIWGYLEPAHDAAGHDFLAPFMDPDLVDLALTIPPRYKVGPRGGKRVLRRAAQGLLPDSILNRPKAIQRVRHDTELSDVLDAMADGLLSPEAVRVRGLVDPAYVAALRRRGAEAYATERLYRLWTLLSLEIWSRQFLDAQTPAPAVSRGCNPTRVHG